MSDHLRNLLGEPMVGHPDYREPHRPYVVCRHCGKTEEEHRPASEPNRPRARCPCLMWRENFAPRLNQPSAAAIPRCHNCGMVVSREGAPCERAIPCGTRPAPFTCFATTDAVRLAVVRELWKLHTESGRIHMDQTLTEYERLIRERTK